MGWLEGLEDRFVYFTCEGLEGEIERGIVGGLEEDRGLATV